MDRSIENSYCKVAGAYSSYEQCQSAISAECDLCEKEVLYKKAVADLERMEVYASEILAVESFDPVAQVALLISKNERRHLEEVVWRR